MMETNSNTNKLILIQSIGMWVVVLLIAGWLVLKPDNTLSKDTVDKLTYAVDGMATASKNLTEVANSQREWYTVLQKSANQTDQKRNQEFGDLYAKYDYSKDNNTVTLNDIYDRKLHEQAQAIGSKHLRGDKDGTGKAGTVQGTTGKPQG